MKRHTLFISDLHLEPRHTEILSVFLYFMRQHAPKAEALYILGDFFEAWIGDDHSNDFYETIKSSMRSLARKGVNIYLMRGNRDFLLGPRFAKEADCQLIEDPTIISLYGNRTILTHGDSLCVHDTSYLRFRRLANNKYLQKIFLALPISLRHKIARKIRTHSEDNHLTKPYSDIPQQEIMRIIKAAHARQIIHGHTHKPKINSLILGNREVNHIVLGAWGKEGNALIYKEDGTMQLQTIKFPQQDKEL